MYVITFSDAGIQIQQSDSDANILLPWSAIRDVSALPPQRTVEAGISGPDPISGPAAYTVTLQYVVRLNLTNWPYPWEDIPMGQTDQVGWNNDLAGQTLAVADITAAIPSGGGGSGTVTSVAMSGGTTGLTFSGGPITGAGTFTAGGVLAVANGGTGSSSSIIASSISDGDTTHAPDGNSVFDALALKAPLVSPTFSGVPVVPTAAPGTNTTQAASTAYADTAVGNKTELHKSYTQTGHGFVAKDLLYWVSSNTYAKAKADSSTTSDVSLFVISVTDANTFVAASPGSVVTGLTGLTAGQQFLSAAAAGAMTTTAPSTVGQVNAPVGVSVNTTTFEFLVQRPYIIGSPAGEPYLEYTVGLTQAGTGSPVATILSNTAGLVVTWSRDSEGQYAYVFGTPITSSQASVDVGCPASADVSVSAYLTGGSVNDSGGAVTSAIFNYDGGLNSCLPSDNVFQNTRFQILIKI